MIKLNEKFSLYPPDELSYDCWYFVHINCVTKVREHAMTIANESSRYDGICHNCMTKIPQDVLTKAKFIIGELYATCS